MHRSPAQSRKAIYEFFMLGLCCYVLIGLTVTTFVDLTPETRQILNVADNCICLVFLADFIGKLYLAPNRWRYMRWGWIDLLSSIPVVDSLRWGRFARIVRILRLLRGVRSCKTLIEMMMRHRTQSAFSTVLLTVLLVVVMSSIAMLEFEGGHGAANISTSEDSLWWALTTVTGVGYGDLYPVTSTGRTIAAFTMLAGLMLFSSLAGLIASWLLASQEAEQDEELQAISARLSVIETMLQQLIERDEQRRLDATLHRLLPETDRTTGDCSTATTALNG